MTGGNQSDRLQRRRKILSGVGVVACCAMLAACGGSSSGGSSASEDSGDAGSTTNAQAGLRVPAGQFVSLVSAVPPTMDKDSMACLGNLPCIVQLGAIASPLLRPKQLPSTSKTVAGVDDVDPYLATKWKRESNGDYTFTLRDAKSQFGNKLTADDVAWSFQRAMALSPGQKGFAAAAGIDTKDPITVVDPKTVRLNVIPPGGPSTLAVASNGNFGILDSVEAKTHATSKDRWAAKWLDRNTDSFGAYQLAAFTPNKSITLKQNPNYWDPPYYKTVRIEAVPDPSSRLQLMMSGRASHTTALSWTQFQNAHDQGAKNGVTAFAMASANADAIGLNQKYAPFAKVQVRQAINMAIDRDAINKLAFKGYAQPIVYPYPSSLTGGYKPPPTTYDPEGAKKLLAEAGYPKGFSFTMATSPAVTGDYVNEELSLIQSELAQVGVTMKINLIASPAELRELGQAKRLEAHLQGVGAQVPSPIGFLAGNFAISPDFQTFSTQDSPENPQLYADLAKASQTPPGPEADAISEKAIKEFADFRPVILTDTLPVQVVTRSDITGFSPTVITLYDQLKSQ